MENQTYKYVIYPGNNHIAIQQALNCRNVWQSIPVDKLMSANLVWRNLNFTPKVYNDFQELLKYDRGRNVFLNHFQYNNLITTKSGLLKSLKYYYSHQLYQQKKNLFQTMPTTFIITAHKQTTELKDWKNRFEQLQEKNYTKQKMPSIHCQKNIWFIKPESENQGRGIMLSNNIKQLQSFINSKPVNSNWIVQKAIEKPYLYQGRKFDIRLWAIVSPNFEIYYYKIPYMRTSSHFYSLQDFSNNIHLTNNSLQKTKQQYSKYQKGNTLPLKNFRDQILKNQKYKQNADQIIEKIIQRMKQLVLDTFLSTKKLFFRNYRRKQFELFGFDFMIDEQLRTWLIQVNNNPYIGSPNDFIKDLIPKMINEMFQIILDPIFPPKDYKEVSQKNYELLYRQPIGYKLNSKRGLSSDKIKNSFNLMYPAQIQKGDHFSVRKQRQRRNSQALSSGQNSLYMGKIKYSTPVQTIKGLLDNYCFNDYQPFFVPVNFLLTSAKLQQKQHLQTNEKNLKLITQTRITGILLQTKFLQTCREIIISDKYQEKIKTTLLNGFINGIKTNRHRLSALKKIGTALGALIIKRQTKNQEMSAQFLISVMKFLIKIGGHVERKIFIPGQTRDSQQVRQVFIKSNLLGVLMHLKERYPQTCQEQIKQFLSNFNQKDWDAHSETQIKIKSEGLISFHQQHSVDLMSTSLRLDFNSNNDISDKMRTSLKNIFQPKTSTNRSLRNPPLPKNIKPKNQN